MFYKLAFAVGLWLCVCNKPFLLIYSVLFLLLFVLGLSFVVPTVKRSALFFILSIFLSFIYFLVYSTLLGPLSMPKELLNHDLIVKGEIVSLPKSEHCYSSFNFKLSAIKEGREWVTNDQLIRLADYACRQEKYRYGQIWQVHVRLKQFHSLGNPGAFNLTQWARVHHLTAKGYVKSHPLPVLLDDSNAHFSINSIREHLVDQLNVNVADGKSLSLIKALTVGIKEGDYRQLQSIFIHTGTSHLMAISGLHVLMVSGASYLLLKAVLYVLARFSIVTRRLAILEVTAIFVPALLYSFMAGFGLPTQRALIMLGFILLARLSGRKILSLHVLVNAFIVCLLLNPYQVLSNSLWLSFAAVLALGVLSQVVSSHKSKIVSVAVIQVGLFVLLLPLVMHLFNRAPLSSLLTNLVAVPLVGFIILPLSLLGVLFLPYPAIANSMLMMDGVAIHALLSFLSFFANYMPFYLLHHLPIWKMVLAIVFSFSLFQVSNWLSKVVCIFGLLIIYIYHADEVSFGQAKLTMLDVGQGLSVVVQTQHHLMVYDAGAKFPGGFNMGDAAVIPFLDYFGVGKVDLLVISHGDNDHIGGAYALLENKKVKQIITSVPEKFSHADYCLSGDSWQWDGVKFEFLYPDDKHLHKNNNSSCVLKITAQQRSALLTGDIESQAESYLVQHSHSKLSAAVLVVPHHGSATSSTLSFLNAVTPSVALFSYGRNNRYHFPNKQVMQRYHLLGIKTYATANRGATTIIL